MAIAPRLVLSRRPAGAPHFDFVCPERRQLIRSLLDKAQVDLLATLVAVEELDIPDEALEVHDGPALTADDLIDLMLAFGGLGRRGPGVVRDLRPRGRARPQSSATSAGSHYSRDSDSGAARIGGIADRERARMPEHEAMAGHSVASLDADETRLHELGYEQELKRALHAFDNVAMGFTAISPVVALYGVVGVGLVLAGPAWVWVLPVALAGQCLVLVVYAELASEFPVANASYQWSRRLLGPTYGWINGWVCLCAYAAANTTIAYLAAPWALSLLAVEPTPGRIVATGAALIAVCATVSAIGIDTLKAVIAVGISAEVIATVVIGLSLLGLRQQPASILTEDLGAVPPGGSAALAMMAALAVGGWVFIGFDACGQSAEETHDATRHVPRAVWIALLSVGVLVILNAVAIILAHPDPVAVVEGRDLDPVTTAVVGAFGSWSEQPLAAVVLAAFVACGMASQNMTARAIFSVSRDGVLPGSALLRRVNARRVPLPAIVLTALLSCAGLLLGLEAAAIGSLIAFGTAGIYATFLLLCVAALVARIRGRWVPSGRLRLGRLGLACNVLAVLWLVVETINIAWPRSVLAPEGAPWYQVWAAALLLAVIAVVGLGYLVVARPQRRLADLALDQSTGTPTYAGPWGPHA